MIHFVTAVSQHEDDLFLGLLHGDSVGHVKMPASFTAASEAGGAPALAQRPAMAVDTGAFVDTPPSQAERTPEGEGRPLSPPMNGHGSASQLRDEL